MTYKKNVRASKSRQKRVFYVFKKIEQYKRKKMAIVYVDESRFSYNMARTHDYSRIGKSCYGSCDWNTKGCKDVAAVLYGSSIIR